MLGVHACGAVGLAGQRVWPIMGHTSDVLCGAGIVSRTGETGARVAAIIAAGENATGVTTGVAAGIAAAVATVVATEETKAVATVWLHHELQLESHDESQEEVGVCASLRARMQRQR